MARDAASEGHLDAFIEMLRHLREPLLIASPSGEILATNAAGADALGTSVAALEGAPLADYALEPGRLPGRLNGPDKDVPFALCGQDGRRFVCDASVLAPEVVLLRLSGGPDAALRAWSFDSAHRLGIDPLARDGEGASRLERLHAFTRTLAQSITLPDVIEAVVDSGLAATAARGGGLWLLSDDGSTVSLVRAVGVGGPRPERYADVPLAAPMRMPILDAIRSGTPVWLESCAEMEQRYPEAFSAFSRGGETALACLPLFAQGRCIGGFTYNYAGALHFGDEERAFLQVLAWHSAQAIERARLYAAARDADRQKDEFLATLSHELRNPLAPIVSALDVMRLRGGEVFASERAVLARHVQHIVRLVDDLLDIAGLAHGKIQLRMEIGEVSPLIAKAVEMVSPLVAQRGHHLTFSAPPHGIPVLADPARLAQTIANLLSNASRYTAVGGEITVTALAAGSEAVIRVRDSGIGLTPAALSRIFDLFVQESPDGAHGGLGIGLSIVKKVVALHGGTVSAHSEGPGKGSEFVVRLPLAAVDAGGEGAASGPGAPREPDRERVLLVDDNVDAVNMIGEALEVLGHTVRIAYDGPSALVAAEEFKPHVALVDIGLPVMSGYELVGRLRVLRSPPKTIVAVTGFGQPRDFARSREAGFDEHIVKPVNFEVLCELLERSRTAR